MTRAQLLREGRRGVVPLVVHQCVAFLRAHRSPAAVFEAPLSPAALELYRELRELVICCFRQSVRCPTSDVGATPQSDSGAVLQLGALARDDATRHAVATLLAAFLVELPESAVPRATTAALFASPAVATSIVASRRRPVLTATLQRDDATLLALLRRLPRQHADLLVRDRRACALALSLTRRFAAFCRRFFRRTSARTATTTRCAGASVIIIIIIIIVVVVADFYHVLGAIDRTVANARRHIVVVEVPFRVRAFTLVLLNLLARSTAHCRRIRRSRRRSSRRARRCCAAPSGCRAPAVLRDAPRATSA